MAVTREQGIKATNRRTQMDNARPLDVAKKARTEPVKISSDVLDKARVVVALRNGALKPDDPKIQLQDYISGLLLGPVESDYRTEMQKAIDRESPSKKSK